MDHLASIAAAAAAQPVKVELPDPVAGRELHIDGDYAAYFCSGNDETAPGIARRTTIERFEGMARRCGATKIIVHLTAGASHKGLRYFVSTIKPYQGQRSGGRKPKNWEYLRNFLETYDGERFVVKTWHNREADDGMALCAYHGATTGKEVVIATRDKDMRMLPGIHMDWMSQRIDAVVPMHCYSLEGEVTGLPYGYKWLLLQLLQGDTADNIPGLERVVIDGKTKQCGEKTAEGLLAHVDGIDIPDSEKLLVGWNVVEDAYASYYKDDWPDRMAEQLCLLYLRHDFDADVASWTKNPVLRSVSSPALQVAADRLKQRVLKEEADLAQAQDD